MLIVVSIQRRLLAASYTEERLSVGVGLGPAKPAADAAQVEPLSPTGRRKGKASSVEQ